MIKRALHYTYRTARRIVIAIIGGTVVLIGIVMIVTPGPAVVVIPAGLAILSLEFAWARHWLHKFKETSGNLWEKTKEAVGRNNKTSNNKNGNDQPPTSS